MAKQNCCRSIIGQMITGTYPPGESPETPPVPVCDYVVDFTIGDVTGSYIHAFIDSFGSTNTTSASNFFTDPSSVENELKSMLDSLGWIYDIVIVSVTVDAGIHIHISFVGMEPSRSVVQIIYVDSTTGKQATVDMTEINCR